MPVLPDSARSRTGPALRQEGAVLLLVLVLLFLVGGSSASFVWFMNQQQARAGERSRAGAALALAEAGVHRALSILETYAPDGSPGRTWRPSAYSETHTVGALEGRFTVALRDHPDGSLVVTSTGVVGTGVRRLRARVCLASPALLAALYGAATIRIEDPPASTVINSYGLGPGSPPWVHIAAGREVWFATTNVVLNDPSIPVEVIPGPLDRLGFASLGRPGPVRLLLARGAQLTLLRGRLHVDVQQLRAMGVHLDGTVLRVERLPPPPEVDRAFYQGLAASNVANAGLNEAVGTYFGDADLARKRDSLYSSRQFELLQRFLAAGLRAPILRGVVYLRGGLGLAAGQTMWIQEGALVAERGVYLSEGATLEITHSQATRMLPGLVTLEPGGLTIRQRGRLRAHGLVYGERFINVAEDARMEVVGAVVGADRELSFLNAASTVVILYDQAVLGTPGLRLPNSAPVVAWVASLEELP
ncbi:MAG: hypothetical protein QN131_05345 [Armatimonadota bacterium]|nr:hypothetical protein [Armatimonadota bacterium]MDR7549352.1 hypothetical protein [Armatimonadota bacterium]